MGRGHPSWHQHGGPAMYVMGARHVYGWLVVGGDVGMVGRAAMPVFRAGEGDTAKAPSSPMPRKQVPMKAIGSSGCEPVAGVWAVLPWGSTVGGATTEEPLLPCGLRLIGCVGCDGVGCDAPGPHWWFGFQAVLSSSAPVRKGSVPAAWMDGGSAG